MIVTIDKSAYNSSFVHFGAKKLTFDEKFEISGHFQ
jgi:hypothetical protein